MTVRRINHTGRVRLRKADMRFTIYESDGRPAQFTADLDFSSYGLSGDAWVFVEAQRQTSWMRFPFGTVTRIRPPQSLLLSEFDSPEGVLFRVRITMSREPKGRILAEADGVRPRKEAEEETDREPLISVKPDDSLYQEVCRVDFADPPLLLINGSLGDYRAVARNPAFAALTYPSVMREILTRILRIEEYFETDDMTDWRCQWLRFSTLLPGTPDLPEEIDPDAIDTWIDEAVAAFCRHNAMSNRFAEYWNREGTS